MSNGDSAKKPLKLLKIALNNFKETALPYHVKLLEERKNAIQECEGDSTKLHNQQIIIKRTESQLKSLLYELDTLRAQVQDCDLDKFDENTVALRKAILQIINEYKEIKNAILVKPPEQQEESTASNEPRQLQISADLQQLKLQERESCLRNVEQIQCDIQDLHSMYGELNQMVVEQAEKVDIVESNVEETEQNVDLGTKQIIKASRLKAAVYPATGAVIGGIMGGPVGLLAGTKVGGIVALVCGGLGYLGGRLLNRHKKIETVVQVITENEENYIENAENKKDE